MARAPGARVRVITKLPRRGMVVMWVVAMAVLRRGPYRAADCLGRDFGLGLCPAPSRLPELDHTRPPRCWQWRERWGGRQPRLPLNWRSGIP